VGSKPIRRRQQQSPVLESISELELFETSSVLPWRRGIVAIASASRKEDIGFESRQGVRFLGLYMYIAVLL
jgi:hypothetical protein